MEQEILSSVCLSEGCLDRLIFDFVKKKQKKQQLDKLYRTLKLVN